MARKTFISYKYDEARELRDRIIKSLGDDSTYYQGETSDSPDLTDTSTENIKKNLKDMIWDTSVTIVIISPKIKKSEWIAWEIEYSLKETKRQDTTSRTNGVVGVIMKYNGGYDWFIDEKIGDDGCKYLSYKSSLLPDIIKKNISNQIPKKYSCESCRTINRLTGNYISFIKEADFLADPQKYIENAWEKSQNPDEYRIVKQER